ncbi:MAG: flagellar hook-associated protein FlgK [Actinomycetota bacterium]
MSFGGLRIGSSGLTTAQRALETAAHNVANANTIGYSRQRIETSTARALTAHRGVLGPGSTGQGVSMDAIGRATDTLLQTNHRQSLGQLASWGTRANFFARAEQVLGPLDSGLSQDLVAFWNSWEDLSQRPESSTSRDQVLAAGSQLAGQLNQASRRIEGLRGEVSLDMNATIDRVNDLTAEIARLNGQVKSARASGSTPNDLLDRRDVALAELTELTGAVTTTEDDGDVRVTLNNLPLVQGVGAEALDVTGTPPVVIWAADGSTAGMAGELGSLVELGGPVVDDLAARLDEIATELRDLVNATHAVGYGLDGVDGRDFFVGTDAGDLAVDSALTTDMVAASATGATADGNQALALGGLRSVAGSGGATVGELFEGLQGFLGLEAQQSAGQRDLAELVVEDVERSLAEVIGVSTDEELTDMLQYQRAYEASARVITVIDEMLDRLINGTGATR